MGRQRARYTVAEGYARDGELEKRGLHTHIMFMKDIGNHMWYMTLHSMNTEHLRTMFFCL